MRAQPCHFSIQLIGSNARAKYFAQESEHPRSRGCVLWRRGWDLNNADMEISPNLPRFFCLLHTLHLIRSTCMNKRMEQEIGENRIEKDGHKSKLMPRLRRDFAAAGR